MRSHVKSGSLKIVNACLLSWLLVVMPAAQLARASVRESEARVQERSLLSGSTVSENAIEATGASGVLINAPIPKPAPEPSTLLGPVIVATKDDGLAAATPVAPGGVITYTVNIKNNGTTSPADDATNVLFSDQIDAHTTLVAGSPVAAVSDKYTAVGNTTLSIPDGATDLLGNDFDPDTGNNTGMTATAETKSSTSCTGSCSNNVTINANGSFTYNPPISFTGTDTFTYSANSGGATASETVKITVTGMIWYVKNDATACTLITSGCGTLSTPFSTLAAFQAVNDGAAGPPQHPKTNDTIFIYTGVGNYTGGVTLLNGQNLIGQGTTASLTSILGVTPSGTSQLPATSGTNPVLTTASLTDNVRLGTNNINLIRGFTVGNSGTATGDSSDISGSNIGTLTVNEVTLNGTGRTLNLNGGVEGGTLSGSFTSITTTAATGQGMTLTNLAGTVSFGSTNISGHSSQCISLSNSTADINFGNTTCAGGTEGVLLSTNSAGIRTFGTLSITGGSAGGFIHSGNGAGIGGGDVNIAGAATISGAGNGISVSTPVSGDLIDFQAATSVTSSTSATGVFWSGAAGAEIKFNSLTIQTNGGTGLSATTGGTITVTNNTGTINNTAQAAPAIVAANVALNVNFDAIKSSGGVNGISLTTVSGTSTFGANSTLAGATGATFLVSGGTASVTYNGNLTQATAAQPLVSVTNGHQTGTIAFNSGTLSATNGTGLQFDNADGIYNFNGTSGSTTLAGAGDEGIDILNGSAGTFTFGRSASPASFAITSPSGTAFNLVGGTASVTYSGNITQATVGQAMVSVSGGHTTGTITFQSGTLSATNGTGLQFDNADSTTSYNFNGTTTLNGGDAGIDILNSSAGTFNFGGTTITNPSGVALFVSTSTGAISMSGAISKNTDGKLIDFDNYDNGTATISGNLSCTSVCDGVEVTNNGASSGTVTFSGGIKTLNTSGSVAVNLDNNDGGAVNFNGGGLDIDTTTAAGFNAINGGTVNVTTGANANTINSTTGRAFNGNGVTFGASGLTFKSISASGGTNGIVFTSTSGNFTVTGDGTGFANGSGGSLTNISGNVGGNAPIYELTSSGTLTFKSMNMSLNTTAFSGPLFDNNAGGTLTVNMTGCTLIGVRSSVDQNKALLQFEAGNTGANAANLTVNVQNSFFYDNRTYGMFATAAGDAILDVTLNQSGFGSPTNTGAPVNNPGHPSGTITTPPPFAVGITAGSNAKVDYDVTNNTFWGAGGAGSGAIYVVTVSGAAMVSTSHMNGFFTNNKIGKAGVVGSGCAPGCAGLGILPGTHGTVNTVIMGNEIRQVNSFGINVFNSAGGATHDTNVIATITNNTLAEPDTAGAPPAASSRAILYSIGNSGGSAMSGCLTISGNSISGPWAAGAEPIRPTTLNTTGTLVIPGLSPASGANDTQVEAYISGLNSGAGVVAAIGGPMNGGAACATPLQLGEGGVDAMSFLTALTDLATNASGDRHNNGTVSSLDQGQLDAIVAAAMQRWSATGLTQQQMAAMRELKFEVSDLAGSYLGEASSDRIVVDRNARGKGWFVDTTPADDLEFGSKSSATRRYTNPYTAAAGRVDLLTAIEHEIGHKLGLTDSYSEKDRDSIMYGYLTVGERRLPARDQARGARGGLSGSHFLKLKEKAEGSKQKAVSRKNHAATTRALAPVSGETVSANIGTLPAGGSVTITFQVTVNNPPNLSLLNAPGPRVENQGTVTADGGISVLTDDPNVGGAADKTATRVDLFDTTTSVITSGSPSNQGDAVTFTATVNETPVQGSADPTGTVQFLDGVTPLTCTEGGVNGIRPLSGGTAACTTSSLSAAAHTINANYSGDGSFDSSSGNVSQTVIACTTNPIVTSTADSGAGSLREAITNACNGSTITFNIAGAGPHSITLTTGELGVARNVTIKNNSGKSITVSGNLAGRVFNINAGKTAAIIGLTITNGNSTQNGGGILNDGTLTIVNSTLTGNATAIDGGAISNSATAISLTLINTTVSGNAAAGSGGGVIVLGGTMTSINSTFSNNAADSDNNSAGSGGGIRAHAGTTTLTNTIVAGNFNEDGASDAADDISGTVDAASSNNLIGDAATAGGLTHGSNGNIVGNAGIGTIAIAAVLNPTLANNSGLTNTHALVPGGPAVESGSNANLPTDTFDLDSDANTAEALPVDQRGVTYPRVADSADADTTQTVDIGAFEVHPSIENIPNDSTNEDTVKNVTFNLGDGTGALIASVTATSSNTTLVPNAPANLSISGSGGSRTLTITPNTNASGVTTITITVTATNGRTATDTFDLTVNPVNDPPTLVNNGITVTEGSTANIITSAHLALNDPDNPPANTLGFQVTGLPSNGTLKKNATPLGLNDTFTQEDINNNLITYDHNGSETTSDSFNFIATDGTNNIGSTTFNITVTPQNDAPTMGNNTGTTVNEGSTANVITSAMLSVNDVDTVPAQLTFTVGTAPANGTLKKSGVGLSAGGTFTQADINGSQIAYDHNGTETTSDSFTFTVSDGAGGSIGTTAFNITVTPQNDGPTVTTTVANLTYNENDAATPVDAGLTVTDSDSATLTGASASITGNFQSAQDALAWVDNNGADNITLDGSSTAQTIVLAGSDTPANYQAALRAVTYQNSSDNPSTLTRTVTFSANDGTATGQGTRNITVNAQNDNPTLTTNAGLSVVNAGTGTINNTKLKVDDVDNTAAQLTFTVGTATTNGTLKKGASTLSAGGTFTQADIDGNLITYTHNGTATTTDSFTFTVSDGAGGSIGGTTFNITIGNPNLSINDAKVPEPASPNTVDMTFTVSLAAPAGASGATVNFQTNNGSATAGTCGNPGADYVSTSGQVIFTVGQQVKTINVPICSDAVADDGETFTITLSGAVNATIVDGTATGTITGNTPGTLLISELRTSGPGGAGDDFVEIYNNTNSPLTVAASDASAGYGLYKMAAGDCNGTPVLIGVIPNGTIIPARGHYLFVGSAYSLANYGGTGAAAGNLTLSTDIETDANVGLFTTSNVTGISSVNRFDAVGFGLNTGGACNLLREGSTLPSVVGNETAQYSLFRKMCEWLPGQGCTLGGQTKDTNNNSVDFWLADTAALAFTGRLGAPGPENLGSPIRRDNASNPGSGGIDVFVLDGNVGPAVYPNRTRTSVDAPSTFGSMTLRYRVTNNTGAPVTRLRYRIVDISTAIQPVGPNADLRALTSSIEPSVGPVNDSVTCTAGGAGSPPCTVVVQATTLETPPNQAIGGGYNSTLSSGTITLGNPLTTTGTTKSILINFKLGVEKTGTFRFYIIVEALP